MVIMEKSFEYIHNGQTYNVYVTYKIKSRYIRYYFKDGYFKVSCPYLTSKKKIEEGLDKFYDSLVKRNPKHNAIGEDFIYLLGHKIAIYDAGEINFTDGSKLIYKDKNDLLKKTTKWFKEHITARTRYFEKMMKIPEYKVRVRDMSTRYGSNALATHSITYATVLMHFSKEIIDAIVVHELAHYYQRNHQSKFYKIIYKYYPDYDLYHKKLRKGEFN
jgi:predicted metal-dependent hydrolase